MWKVSGTFFSNVRWCVSFIPTVSLARGERNIGVTSSHGKSLTRDITYVLLFPNRLLNCHHWFSGHAYKTTKPHGHQQGYR